MSGSPAGRVLIWGPAKSEAAALTELLVREGFRAVYAESLEDAEAIVRAGQVDLVFARLAPDFDAPLELLTRLQAAPSAPPVLIVTEGSNVKLYLEAMRRGAFDCVGLPLLENEVLRIVSLAGEARDAHAALAPAAP